MATVVDVKAGIDTGYAQVSEVQVLDQQVVEGAQGLDLESVAGDFDGLARRLAALAEGVGEWPIAPAQAKRSQADVQLNHTLQGGMDHPFVQQAISNLGEMGTHLRDGDRMRMSLRDKLLAIGSVVTDLARQVREDAIPRREAVKQGVVDATASGEAAKEKVMQYKAVL